MSDTKTELLTLSMSLSDLATISKSLEKSVIASQLELAEMEKKSQVLRLEIEKQIAMLSVMKSRLES